MNKVGFYRLMIAAFVLGSLGAVGVYNRIKPNAAQQQQMMVDQTIRSTLCERISTDLVQYAESPLTYRRTSLKQLTTEAREITKTLVPLSVSERGIAYRNAESTLTQDCARDAQRWVKIPTVVPDEVDEEIRIVGLRQEQSIWQKLHPATEPRPVAAREAHGRLALVIGNAEYDSRPLRNPEHDAEDVAEFLRSANFEVREIKNAHLAALKDAAKKFVEDVNRYEVALVYYSGHGIEFQGRNYLIPVDASIKSDAEIPRMSLDLEDMLTRINRMRPKAVVMIIDACRSTPLFASSRSLSAGLADMRPPTGTLIAFSAAPGQTASEGSGRNSPYTAALLREMRVPNTPIEQILKETRKDVSVTTMDRQVPWYNSSLVGDFYFIRN